VELIPAPTICPVSGAARPTRVSRNPGIEESLSAFFGDDLTNAHLKMAETPVSGGLGRGGARTERPDGHACDAAASRSEGAEGLHGHSRRAAVSGCSPSPLVECTPLFNGSVLPPFTLDAPPPYRPPHPPTC
jgi:hypothetical protein